MWLQKQEDVFSVASPHWPWILPVVSKCSFDSLSLQECFEEFLIGLFGLPAQLLFSLPPQNLPKAKLNNRRGGNQTNTGGYVLIQEAPEHTRVCFFSSGASPSNTNTGLMRKKRSLQIRWKRVRRCAFWTLLPSRSLTPFTAWFSHILMSGCVWLRLKQCLNRRQSVTLKKWREGNRAVFTQCVGWNKSRVIRSTFNQDTNSEDLSFQSLGVDGFPCTFQQPP